ASVQMIGTKAILRLPKAASGALPSRGLCLVEGTFDDRPFHTALEPDGAGGHWFEVSKAMLRTDTAIPGGDVAIAIAPMAVCPEPDVPADLARALEDDPDAQRLWMDITPLARWDWIRWIRSTRNPETRAIRIHKTL